MNNLKVSPVGIDVAINDFQTHLFNAVGIPEWEMYPRVYHNPRKDSMIPEFYNGDNEYVEVMYNDDYIMSSFFITDTDRDLIIDGHGESNVSLIVQADLRELYPSITHRADEELTNLIHVKSNSFIPSSWFTLESASFTIDKVYREFDKTRITFDDMSNRYVARFEYKVRYAATCV